MESGRVCLRAAELHDPQLNPAAHGTGRYPTVGDHMSGSRFAGREVYPPMRRSPPLWRANTNQPEVAGVQG